MTLRVVRSLAAIFAVALAGLGVFSCSSVRVERRTQIASGGGKRTPVVAPILGVAAGSKYYVGDHDDDDFKHSELDSDDHQLRDYGNAARAGDRRAISAVVMHYLGAAGAGNTALACSLLARRPAAPGLSVEVPEAYRPPAKNCSEEASRIFSENHAELAAELPTAQVTAVRVGDNNGLALLGFTVIPERWIAVAHEGYEWKVDALLDSEVP